MRAALWTTLLFASLFAYEKGDRIDQKTIDRLRLQKEKVYIIDFFASWCHSCEKEMPHLVKLDATLDRSKFELIGVDVDKDLANATAFQSRMKERFGADFRIVNDPEGVIIKTFKPLGMPSLYIVKENKVAFILTGATDDIDRVVTERLKALP